MTATSAVSATIALLKRISFPERAPQFFSDENYAVHWKASAFFAVRKVDGAQVGGPYGSEELAIRHIKNRYPVPT